MPRPRTATRSTAMAITRWRGIIEAASQSETPPAVLGFHASLGGSELVVSRCDGGGDGAGDELLIVGGGELCQVGSLRRDFDGDGGAGDVVQRAERSAQGANRNLALQQFGGDGGRSAAAERQRCMLGQGPGTKGTAVVVSVR